MGVEEVYPAWNRTVKQVLQHHNVDPNVGLSATQVEELQSVYGYNELQKASKPSIWSLILEQFDDTLVKVRHIVFGVSLTSLLPSPLSPPYRFYS